MGKQTVINPYHGRLLSINELTTDRGNTLDGSQGNYSE